MFEILFIYHKQYNVTVWIQCMKPKILRKKKRKGEKSKANLCTLQYEVQNKPKYHSVPTCAPEIAGKYNPSWYNATIKTNPSSMKLI